MASNTAAPSLQTRILGVLRAPRRTFRAIGAAPRWADVQAATFLVATLASAAVLVTDVGRLALLDQWERMAFAVGRNVTDAEYAAMAEASGRGVLYAIGVSLASGPLLAVAVSSLVWVSFGTRGRGVTFRQLFAVVAHAGVVLALRQVVAAPVTYARESLASPLTLGSLVPGLDEGSAAARFLAAFDVFVVWWVLVLAVGVSVLYRQPALRLALVSLSVYAAGAGLLASVIAILGGTA